MSIFEAVKERLGLGRQARLDAGEPAHAYSQEEIDAAQALHAQALQTLWEYDALLKRQIEAEKARATPNQNRLIILEHRQELIDHEDLQLSYALSEMELEDIELCRVRHQALIEEAEASEA